MKPGFRKRFHKRKSISRVFSGLVLFSSLAVFLADVGFILFLIRFERAREENLPLFIVLYPVVIVVIFFFIFLISRHIIRKRVLLPLSQIAETTENYAVDKSDGVIDDFYFGHLRIDSGDEFEELAALLAGMEQDISDSEQKLIQATAERQRMATELEVAKSIQDNMLPTLFPPYPERTEFEIYATMDPAKEVGGDFYDFFLIDDGHLGIVMADVSGKGIPAALFMMSSMIIIDNYASLGYSPKQVLEISNKTICDMELSNMFVTVWFGILDLKTGAVTAANAGHEYPAIRQADGNFALMKNKHDFVIGGIEDAPYHEYSFTMQKGATLFLYTDGVPEASNAENELYGTDRMLAALNANKDLAPDQLLKAVRKDVDRFVDGASQFDDLTMLCVTYLG